MTALLERLSTAKAPHPYRTELRRGFGPLLGALVAAVLTCAMFVHAAGWHGTWISTTEELREIGGLLCAPLAIAGGCWLGGHDRRRGTLELQATTPRSPLRRTLLACAPAACWPAAGYLLAAAVCLTATWPAANAGHPFLSMTLADAAALAAFGAVGFALGRVLPWRLAAPFLAVLTYVAMGMMAYVDDDNAIRWLSPANTHDQPWDQPVWWAGLVQTLWTTSIAATTLFLLAARRRILALAPLTVAILAAVLLMRTAGGVWQPNTTLAAQVCTDGTPQVCVARVHRGLLPRITAEVQAVRAKLTGVPGVPERFAEAPFRTIGARPPHGEAELDTLPVNADRDRLADPDTYRGRVAHGLAVPVCHDVTDMSTWGDTGLGVVEWLSGVPDPFVRYVGPRPKAIGRTVHRLRTMPEGARRHWLTRYFAAVADCKPEEILAP